MDSDDEVPALIPHEDIPGDLEPRPEPKQAMKVPLTIITGSGRAISVSSADEPAALATEFLELANGCLCCSVKDSGAAAIEKLMHKQGAFDYIMLETTGLADPGPIAAMFWQNEDFSEDIVLDGVICVVDGVFGLKIGQPKVPF
ncbi:COBW domain-containing protein 1 AltName: Full=Cobalamin synthase W domain-containing protein 1 [Rhizoctonia solani AG-1 IB]|uniref:CobW/HypB/UreG nucleotide-binding domain-containing protein n=2 Tax=Rhizoctonia solani TaxID=456999 RepID=A0A8H3BF30_9AGAM|nr:unnamed protein product [Rhizoctonia solani]CCO29179.1 COBW domain-containing protein 1 AltName: Full=Cobalamin synthase W domain-containing protein 1 [Rhizoctonia solani AG-1 IB]